MNGKSNSFFNVIEPDFPVGHSYEEIAKYLIAAQKASYNYYKLVFLCGCLGLALSLILLLFLVCENDGDFGIIFHIKEYPGMICAIVTMAFGHLEMEESKRELYKQLMRVSGDSNEKDSATIVEDYKKWTWKEFQEKFKS